MDVSININGETVTRGQRLGTVFDRTDGRAPSHLHFEIHVHGVPIDPEPALRRWDRYS